MNWLKIRTIMIHILGGVCGYISFFDLNPFSVAYMTAVLIETPYRLSMLAVVLLGVMMNTGIMGVIKYGLIMLCELILTEILQRKWNLTGKYISLSIAAGAVFIVGFIGNGVVALSLAEAILVFALSIILSFVPFNFTLSSAFFNDAASYNEPGKARLCESAEVFSKLSQCFSELPYQKSDFNKSDFERMSNNVYQDFCSKCLKSDECWRNNSIDTYASCEKLFNELQEGRMLTISMVKGRLRSQCIKLHGFLNALTEAFDQARIHLFWYNRLIEHREAVADQLDEMANMIAVVAEEVYENDNVDIEMEELLKLAFRDINVKMDKIVVSYKKDGRQEFFITAHAMGSNKIINTAEMAKVLGRSINKKMMPLKDSKKYITDVPATILFLEKPRFSVICKASRVIKSGQLVSGDNYMFTETEDGMALACLSDGMGSGYNANRESETVIELMERFIDAGFSKETAVKMINSTMVLTDGEPSCSTLDICSIDLYEGSCEFIKMGAAVSFLKREHFVECISSDNLPTGVMSNLDCNSYKIDLYDGDFIIMVSDGIIESLNGNEVLENIISAQNSVNPNEIANNILGSCLKACAYDPEDDMTVLVMGVWEK